MYCKAKKYDYIIILYHKLKFFSFIRKTVSYFFGIHNNPIFLNFFCTLGNVGNVKPINISSPINSNPLNSHTF